MLQNLLYSMGQYATKAEVSQLIAEEYQNAVQFRENSVGNLNALGESPKQHFENLLHESRVESRQYNMVDPTTMPPLPPGAIQEPKFWVKEPSTSSVNFRQPMEPYVLPTQNTSTIPKRTLTAPLEYDSKYTMNTPIATAPRIGGSEGYTPESRWNNFKALNVASTEKRAVSGDSILRSFLGIEAPAAGKESGYTIDGVTSDALRLEDTHTKPAPNGRETPKETLRETASPITIMEIQSKALSSSLGATLSNSMLKSSEETLEQISEGGGG